MRDILHKTHKRRGKTGVFQAVMNGRHDRRIGAEGLPAAPQHDGVSRLQRQNGGIRSHIRSALIDDGDHAERNGGFLDHKSVRALQAFQHPSLRIGQGRDLPDTLCHPGDALRGQCEPVDHHIAIAIPGGFHIRAIRLQDRVLLRQQPIRDRLKSRVFPFP